MTEEERDSVDEVAEKFMKNCSESVYALQKQSKYASPLHVSLAIFFSNI